MAKDPVRSQLVCVSVPPCFITADGPRSAPRASAAEIELTDAGDHSETMMIAQEREQGDLAKMMAAPIGARLKAIQITVKHVKPRHEKNFTSLSHDTGHGTGAHWH